MPRAKKARRFEPRYGVSVATLEIEAGYLRREVEDYALFSAAEVTAKRVEHHANCEHAWQHVCMIIQAMAEHDQHVLQALLFRDLYFVLELYRTYLTSTQPETSSRRPAPARAVPMEFSEWLFEMPK